MKVTVVLKCPCVFYAIPRKATLLARFHAPPAGWVNLLCFVARHIFGVFGFWFFLLSSVGSLWLYTHPKKRPTLTYRKLNWMQHEVMRDLIMMLNAADDSYSSFFSCPWSACGERPVVFFVLAVRGLTVTIRGLTVPGSYRVSGLTLFIFCFAWVEVPPIGFATLCLVFVLSLFPRSCWLYTYLKNVQCWPIGNCIECSMK